MVKANVDLSDLLGDPWATRDDLTDRPDPEEVERDLDALREWIDAQPAGAMSNQMVYVDEGITPDNVAFFEDTRRARQGLHDYEKQILWDASAPAIQSM